MRIRVLPLLALAAVAACLSACRKTDSYPDTPHLDFKDLVSYKDFYGLDTSLLLTVSFTDGDGDLGLLDSDTLPPYNPGSEYYYNLFLKYFKKENGVFNELPLFFPPNQRIPFIVNHSNNKALSGEILLDVEIAGLVAVNDTFRFETWIVDRALNKSNVVTSEEVVLKTQ